MQSVLGAAFGATRCKQVASQPRQLAGPPSYGPGASNDSRCWEPSSTLICIAVPGAAFSTNRCWMVGPMAECLVAAAPCVCAQPRVCPAHWCPVARVPHVRWPGVMWQEPPTPVTTRGCIQHVGVLQQGPLSYRPMLLPLLESPDFDPIILQ